MALKLITAPVARPLTVQDVSDQTRADLTVEQVLIETYIAAVAAKAEVIIGRALITQTWELSTESFSCAHPHGIRLPFSPVQEIVSITYIDTNGDSQIVNPANYYLTGDDPEMVAPVYGTVWPVSRNHPGVVKIRYICGYGDTSDDIPEAIRVWMLMNVAALYENRETVTVGKSGLIELSTLADSLLDSYRLVTFS